MIDIIMLFKAKVKFFDTFMTFIDLMRDCTLYYLCLFLALIILLFILDSHQFRRVFS